MLATSAVLLLLLGGGIAGYLIAKPPVGLFEVDADQDSWVEAIAGEISLYDEASMAAIEVDHTALTAELSKLGQELKLDLSEANVTPEGLTLKRAELLQFQKSKLAWLLYASDKGAPIALCIMTGLERKQSARSKAKMG
jgi:hypothetical protein